MLLIVPPIANLLVQNQAVLQRFDLSSLQNIFCGGAPLAANTSDAFYRLTGIAIRTGMCRSIPQGK